MKHGQSIALGNGGHKFTVVPHEGRVKAYGSYQSKLVEAHLTPSEAREAAATNLDPPVKGAA